MFFRIDKDQEPVDENLVDNYGHHQIAKVQESVDEILVDHYSHNGYRLSFDLGWSTIDNIFFKGYCLDERLEQKIARKDFTEKPGNYVVISLEEGDVVLHTDDSRSFPLWFTEDSFSNLKFDGSQCGYEEKILLKNGQFSKS